MNKRTKIIITLAILTTIIILYKLTQLSTVPQYLPIYAQSCRHKGIELNTTREFTYNHRIIYPCILDFMKSMSILKEQYQYTIFDIILLVTTINISLYILLKETKWTWYLWTLIIISVPTLEINTYDTIQLLLGVLIVKDTTRSGVYYLLSALNKETAIGYLQIAKKQYGKYIIPILLWLTITGILFFSTQTISRKLLPNQRTATIDVIIYILVLIATIVHFWPKIKYQTTVVIITCFVPIIIINCYQEHKLYMILLPIVYAYDKITNKRGKQCQKSTSST